MQEHCDALPFGPVRRACRLRSTHLLSSRYAGAGPSQARCDGPATASQRPLRTASSLCARGAHHGDHGEQPAPIQRRIRLAVPEVSRRDLAVMGRVGSSCGDTHRLNVDFQQAVKRDSKNACLLRSSTLRERLEPGLRPFGNRSTTFRERMRRHFRNGSTIQRERHPARDSADCAGLEGKRGPLTL